MFLSPTKAIHEITISGNKKTKLNLNKLILLSFLAGCYIAFGGLLAIKIGGGMPLIQKNNPGLSSFIFGSVFPIGLMFVSLAGAELFTGNTALLVPALYNGKIYLKDVLRNWFFT